MFCMRRRTYTYFLKTMAPEPRRSEKGRGRKEWAFSIKGRMNEERERLFVGKILIYPGYVTWWRRRPKRKNLSSEENYPRIPFQHEINFQVLPVCGTSSFPFLFFSLLFLKIADQLGACFSSSTKVWIFWGMLKNRPRLCNIILWGALWENFNGKWM